MYQQTQDPFEGETAHELANFGRWIDDPTFLLKFFPVPSSMPRHLLEGLSEGPSPIFDKAGKKWTDLPDFSGPLLRKELYAPFCRLFNTIAAASLVYEEHDGKWPIEEFRKKVEKKRDSLSDFWLDIHSESPGSGDQEAPLIRPDIVFGAFQKELVDTIKHLQKLEAQRSEVKEQIKLLRDTGKWAPAKDDAYAYIDDAAIDTKSDDSMLANHSKDLKMKIEESKKQIEVLWLQIHAICEVKSEWRVSWDTVIQLCDHMKQLFRDQLDRRFILSFAVCGTNIQVWGCDRSGAFGMKRVVCINEDPEDFIRIIGGFAILSRSQLGWDPTMMIYQGPGKPSIESYKRTRKQMQRDRYCIPWQIEVNGKQFVTVKALKLVHADYIAGRASLVWEAVSLDEITNPKKQIYVLKQQWLGIQADADDAKSEADLYNILPLNLDGRRYVGHVPYSGLVTVDGKVDNTVKRIRHGFEQELTDFEYNLPRSRKARRSRNKESEASSTDGRRIKPVMARALHRLIVSNFGFGIRRACDSLELLKITLDICKGMEFMFKDGGIVWGDPSIGNILICPKNDEEVDDTRGVLIDLHLAVYYEDTRKIAVSSDPQYEGKPNGEDDSAFKISTWPKRDQLVQFGQFFAPFQVDDDVMNMAANTFCELGYELTYFPTYIEDVIESKEIPEDCTRVTLQILGWDQYKDYDRPIPGKDEAQRVHLGTLPFVSHERLGRFYSTFYIPGPCKDVGRLEHDAIHDMDSLFLVVLWICLTRGGGGGILRSEFDWISLGQERESLDLLSSVVYHVFEHPDRAEMTSMKYWMYTHSHHFKEFFLDTIHPYWAEMKDVIQKWFELLRLAYRYRALEYDHIHTSVIAVLQEGVNKLEKNPPERSASATQELERRKAELRRIRTAFTPGGEWQLEDSSEDEDESTEASAVVEGKMAEDS